MDLSKINKKTWLIIGAVVLAVVLAFLVSKHANKDKKKVNVTVDISDGNTIAQYDPTNLVAELESTLTTTYFFGGQERCDALKKLFELPNAAFMATVYGYEKATGTSLIAHLDACQWYCHGYHTGDSMTTSYQNAIKDKISILKQTYKQV
ncbi:MAG: hypothetical protein ACRBFS_08060 [Aureispira sp.]